MEILKNERELEDFLHAAPENCVFLHTSNCMIYCYQCDIELYDFSPESFEWRSISNLYSEKETTFNGENFTYLDLRKLFVKPIEKTVVKGVKIDLTGGLGSPALLPLNSLNASLVILYSIDYIRKILKKKYISNLYTIQHYGVQLFPKFLSELSTSIFAMNKKVDQTNQLERFYQLLLKYEPSLSNYTYKNLYVR